MGRAVLVVMGFLRLLRGGVRRGRGTRFLAALAVGVWVVAAGSAGALPREGMAAGQGSSEAGLAQAFETMGRTLEGSQNAGAGAAAGLGALCGELEGSLLTVGPGTKTGSASASSGAAGAVRPPLWDRLTGYVRGKARTELGGRVDQAVQSAPSALCRMAAGWLDRQANPQTDLGRLPGVLGMTGGADLDLRSYALRTALAEGAGWLRGAGLPLTTLEIQTGVGESGEAIGQVLGVLPLWRDASGRHHVMTQLSWNRSSEEGDTVNAGVALRRLSEDKRYLYGINLFLDHGARMNHNRMSVGADLQTTMLGVAANYYIPLSDWRSVDAVWEERAAEGMDLELQGRVPQLPSWQANLRGFFWSGDDTGRNEEGIYGYDAGLEWTPYRFFTLEGGISKAQSADTEARAMIRVQHRLGDGVEQATERTTRLRSVEERVYDKVRRENIIRTERRKKDSALLSVTETVGANSAVSDEGAVALGVGVTVSIPATVTVSPAAGSIARLRFADGALLTIGAGSSVRIEAAQITLITGILQYVSGSVDRTLTTPGSTIALLGTDVDLRYDGASTTLRVRDGLARLAAVGATAAVTLSSNAVGSVIGGAATTLSATDALAGTHTGDAFTKLDLAASAQTGGRLASYVPTPPRLEQSGSTVGEVIEVSVPFTTPVTLGGPAPTITIRVNTVERTATLHSGAGTNTLRFRYTIALADGVVTTLSFVRFNRNGASITGAGEGAGNNAVTDIPATSFAQTASLPAPTLELDFVNGTYRLNGTSYGSFTSIPGATFTRASPAVTYAERSDGTLQAFSANTPRITDKGLLVEGSRTNLLTNSTLTAAGGWIQSANGVGPYTNFTITNNFSAINAPDGTATAIRLQRNSNGAFDGMDWRSPSVTLTSGTTYTASIYMRTADGSTQQIQWGVCCTSINNTPTVTATSAWQRFTLTFTATATSAFNNLRAVQHFGSAIPPVSNPTDILVWGAQLEQAAFASSYIPTTTASVTRSADNAQIAVGSWFNAAQGTLSSTGLPLVNDNNGQILSSIGDNTNDLFALRQVISQQMIIMGREPPATNFDATGSPIIALNTPIRMAGRYFEGQQPAFSLNGASPIVGGGTFGAGFGASYTSLGIGSFPAGGGSYLGYVRSLAYRPTALSDPQLQSLTAP